MSRPAIPPDVEAVRDRLAEQWDDNGEKQSHEWYGDTYSFKEGWNSCYSHILQSGQAEIQDLREALRTYDAAIKIVKERDLALEKLRIAETALEFALEKFKDHEHAYDEDIFPDDKREACQTTAGRMGRHMLKCFKEYLQPASEALEKLRGESNEE